MERQGLMHLRPWHARYERRLPRVATLAQLFMGWPAILGSLGLSIVGISRKRPHWFMVGALLSTGFAWYLGQWPNPFVSAVGFALPFLHLGGAVAVIWRRPWIAWALLSPHAAIALLLSVVVLSQ
jgi:hypothetical protein